MKCITAPGDNALWFMYEPVLMSKKSFDKLNKQQQDALMAAGKKSQEYFTKAEPKRLDEDMVKAFKEHNVEVVTLTRCRIRGMAEDGARRAPTPNSPRKCRTARS